MKTKHPKWKLEMCTTSFCSRTWAIEYEFLLEASSFALINPDIIVFRGVEKSIQPTHKPPSRGVPFFQKPTPAP